MDTHEGVLRFFNPFFTFVETETEKGNNVLIHCLAGAHRAGSTGVSWLMYANNWDMVTAVKKAKSFRRAINPIGSFPNLLGKL
jgi:protein-tyrosine phosphatase